MLRVGKTQKPKNKSAQPVLDKSSDTLSNPMAARARTATPKPPALCPSLVQNLCTEWDKRFADSGPFMNARREKRSLKWSGWSSHFNRPPDPSGDCVTWRGKTSHDCASGRSRWRDLRRGRAEWRLVLLGNTVVNSYKGWAVTRVHETAAWLLADTKQQPRFCKRVCRMDVGPPDPTWGETFQSFLRWSLPRLSRLDARDIGQKGL